MKYLVIFGLVTICANRLTLIEAWTSWIRCPENISTAEECLDHFNLPSTDANMCSETKSDGIFVNITGCRSVICVIKGKVFEPSEDLSKPYPDCCPKCGPLEHQMAENADQSQST